MSDTQPRGNGPIGNSVKIAGSIVDSMKAQPLLLALLVFNIAFFTLWHFTAQDSRARQADLVEHLLANQAKMQEMLSRCGARSDVFAPDQQTSLPQ